MGSSLQEQLLKAGLVTEQQVRREKARGADSVRREKKSRKAPHPGRQRVQASSKTSVTPTKRESPARAVEGVAEHREEQGKPLSPSERKLLRARIKILLRRHRVNDPEAETPYHFLVGKHIRRLYVTDAQHALLCQGQLVIIPFGERHYLIPGDKLGQLQQLDSNLTVIRHESSSTADSEADERYAGYQVPDDLIW